jgi:hypothetical protein
VPLSSFLLSVAGCCAALAAFAMASDDDARPPPGDAADMLRGSSLAAAACAALAVAACKAIQDLIPQGLANESKGDLIIGLGGLWGLLAFFFSCAVAIVSGVTATCLGHSLLRTLIEGKGISPAPVAGAFGATALAGALIAAGAEWPYVQALMYVGAACAAALGLAHILPWAASLFHKFSEASKTMSHTDKLYESMVTMAVSLAMTASLALVLPTPTRELPSNPLLVAAYAFTALSGFVVLLSAAVVAVFMLTSLAELRDDYQPSLWIPLAGSVPAVLVGALAYFFPEERKPLLWGSAGVATLALVHLFLAVREHYSRWVEAARQAARQAAQQIASNMENLRKQQEYAAKEQARLERERAEREAFERHPHKAKRCRRDGTVFPLHLPRCPSCGASDLVERVRA